MTKRTWISVGSVESIPRQGARVVETPIGRVAVFRAHDDTIFALDDRCPHLGGPLSQGIVHGHSVTCPLHNWVISLETGEACEPDEGCTRAIPVKVSGGAIELGLPETLDQPEVVHG